MLYIFIEQKHDMIFLKNHILFSIIQELLYKYILFNRLIVRIFAIKLQTIFYFKKKS